VNVQSTINAYLSTLNSDDTKRTYRSALRLFQQYLDGQEPTVNLAIGFADHIKQRDPKYAKGTVQLYLTAVHRYLRFLLTRGADISATDLARLEEVYRDARNIRGEREPKDPRLSIAEKVIRAARSVPASPGHTTEKRRRELARLRDIAIVETLRSTGCRCGELVGLRISDIKHDGMRATVKGKGSKYRNVYWDKDSWDALVAYLKARGITEASTAPVFVSHGNRAHDGPLTERHVLRTIKELARKAGLEGVTTHTFRHIFATHALDKTGNLALIQDLLGHASPATTRVYARTNERQRREGHKLVWETP